MANETSALRGEPQQNALTDRGVAEDDYQSFSAALGASARGRAFLHEYARRNRHADTEVVLAALDRLETVARSNKIAPEAERIRQDLRALLDTIRSARPQIDSTPGAIKAATLSALIEFVQARLEALVQPMNAPLASVPEPEQPELPIPQPGSAAQRTIALVQAIVPPQPPDVAPVPLVVPQLVAAPQASVLKLDPRVSPEMRKNDLGVGLFEPSRSTRIIPEVNFIDSLFDEIDAKAKSAKAAAEPIELPPPVIARTPDAPQPVETKAASTAAPGDTFNKDEGPGYIEIFGEAEAHAGAAHVIETGVIETAVFEAAVSGSVPVETTFVETAMVETAVAAVTPVMATLETVSVMDSVPAEAAIADPSQKAMSKALAEIMALSEAERLALFT